MTDTEHTETRVASYPATEHLPAGFVAWCSCGVGSPLKPTEFEAEQSLAGHIAEPDRLPQ